MAAFFVSLSCLQIFFLFTQGSLHIARLYYQSAFLKKKWLDYNTIFKPAHFQILKWSCMKNTIWLFAFMILFAECKKGDSVEQPVYFCGTTMLPLDSSGYFAFGKYFGMCGGPNCATFYKIKAGEVYPDSLVHFAQQLVFSATPLSSPNALGNASMVLYILPQEMTDHPDTTFGCPDCHDQGGYYIEYQASSTAPVKYWHIDPDTAYLSNAMRAYMSRVDTALARL